MSSVPRTVRECAQALREGTWTCQSLTEACLRGLEAFNPRLCAMITIARDSALQEAEQLDAEWRAGRIRGPLHGVPLVNKDLFMASGLPCTVGSPLFRERLATRDANVVSRLRSAGCVLLGQANLSEFAAVPIGRNLTYGDVRNPWHTNHSPGTSSSGSAAAVAAGLCLAATGSDTGNSVRAPAAYCGLVGVRPTWGLVGMSGAFPRAPGLDTAGVLTRTAEDAALLLNCLAGPDPDDPHALNRPAADHTAGLRDSLAGLRVAIVDDLTFCDVDVAVAGRLHGVLDALADSGAGIVAIESPLLTREVSTDAVYELLCHEFSQAVGELYDATENRALFDPAVHDDMARGRAMSPERAAQAQAQRRWHREQAATLFVEADVIITPTTPTAAPAYDAPADQWARQKRFMLPVSQLGLPAVSVPCGLVAGLPVAVQLIGNRLAEPLLLRVAQTIERCKLMPDTRPPLYWTP